jgi:thioredoxin reductase (NADPH)
LEPGGQLTTTTDVDNFPGYPNGVDGPTMMNELKEQAERFGTKVKIDFISKVDFSREKGGIHKLYTQNGDEIKSKTVIISTGASAKYLGLESEQRLIGGGVSACAVCDGFFYKNQDVAIVGGGDTAIEEATYLAKICRNVTMLVRKDHFRASKAMQNRLANFDNITVLFNHEINEVIGESVVEGIEIKNNLNDEVSDIKITGLFIAIGHSPNTDIFKGTVNMDESGYILTDKISTKTNIPGVFAAGDVQDKDYRQAITAAGTGCMAALDAERYLQEV